MKNLVPLFSFLAIAALPFAARAQTIVFSDSFENEGTGYNAPAPSDSPYLDPVATAGDTQLTQIIPGSIPGQDGSRYLEIDTSGADDLDTLATKPTVVGTFSLATTYTVSVLMAQPQFGGDGQPGNLFTGILTLLDATTGTTLDSVSHNFATGNMDFESYSFTFDTLTNPLVVGHDIQLSLAADVTAGSFQGTDFDDLVLSSTPDVSIPNIPEPATYALLGLGALTLGLLTRRARARLAS